MCRNGISFVRKNEDTKTDKISYSLIDSIKYLNVALIYC